MSKTNVKIPLERLYESLMELVIENPVSKRQFEEWERFHLRDLTSSNKGYKRSSKSSFKAKVVKSLPESAQLSLFEKLAPSYNQESVPSKEQLSEFRKSLASDLLLGEQLNTINDHPLRFLALYPGLLQSVTDELARIDYAQKSQEFSGVELLRAADASVPEPTVSVQSIATSFSAATDMLLDLALDRKPLDNCDESGVNFAKALVLISKHSESLAQLITSALILDTDVETIRALKSDIDFQLSEIVPRELNTYRVILTDIFELPHSAGYAGKVCAVETVTGNLIPISEELALELFPTRGGVYIPMSAITESASKSRYLPMVVSKSNHEGANHYRMQSLWSEVDQIVDLKNGLDRYDELVEELKSISMPDNRIKIWFRLEDGSLIAPTSQRSTLTQQAFSEKWQFLSAIKAKEINTVYGFASSTKLDKAISISMASNSQILSEIEYLTSENKLIPEYLEPRLVAVKESINSRVSLDDFMCQLVVAMKSREPLASEFRLLLEDEIRRTAPELEGLKKQNESAKSELEDLEQKLSVAVSRLEGVETTLKSKAKEMVKNFKTDLSPILQDPLFLALTDELRGQQPLRQESTNDLNSTVSQKFSSTIVQFKCEQQRSLLKGLGIKSWPDESIEMFASAAHKLMNSGLTLEIFGENGFQLAHLILGQYESGEYETIVTTFAENIDYACSRLLRSQGPALMITGLDERKVALFRSVLQFRAEVFTTDCAPVIFVTNSSCMATVKSVIPIDPSRIKNISTLGEYDEEDFDSDLSELGPLFRKRIKGMEPNSFLDLVYLSSAVIQEK